MVYDFDIKEEENIKLCIYFITIKDNLLILTKILIILNQNYQVIYALSEAFK